MISVRKQKKDSEFKLGHYNVYSYRQFCYDEPANYPYPRLNTNSRHRVGVSHNKPWRKMA
jgi:hypothetical protein